MNTINNLHCRNLLKYMVVAMAGEASYRVWAQADEFVIVNKPSADFHADVDIELTQSTADISFFKGEKPAFGKSPPRY